MSDIMCKRTVETERNSIYPQKKRHSHSVHVGVGVGSFQSVAELGLCFVVTVVIFRAPRLHSPLEEDYSYLELFVGPEVPQGYISAPF